MGVFPITVETGFGGGSTRFLHGTTNSGHTLNLGFKNLTQSEAGLIRTHYRLQDGGHVAGDVLEGFFHIGRQHVTVADIDQPTIFLLHTSSTTAR